jgi:hypothetical protein
MHLLSDDGFLPPQKKKNKEDETPSKSQLLIWSSFAAKGRESSQGGGRWIQSLEAATTRPTRITVPLCAHTQKKTPRRVNQHTNRFN